MLEKVTRSRQLSRSKSAQAMMSTSGTPSGVHPEEMSGEELRTQSCKWKATFIPESAPDEGRDQPPKHEPLFAPRLGEVQESSCIAKHKQGIDFEASTTATETRSSWTPSTTSAALRMSARKKKKMKEEIEMNCQKQHNSFPSAIGQTAPTRPSEEQRGGPPSFFAMRMSSGISSLLGPSTKTSCLSTTSSMRTRPTSPARRFLFSRKMNFVSAATGAVLNFSGATFVRGTYLHLLLPASTDMFFTTRLGVEAVQPDKMKNYKQTADEVEEKQSNAGFELGCFGGDGSRLDVEKCSDKWVDDDLDEQSVFDPETVASIFGALEKDALTLPSGGVSSLHGVDDAVDSMKNGASADGPASAALQKQEDDALALLPAADSKNNEDDHSTPKNEASADGPASAALEKQDSSPPPAASDHGDDDAMPKTATHAASADEAQRNAAKSALQKEDTTLAPPAASSHGDDDTGSKNAASADVEPGNSALQKRALEGAAPPTANKKNFGDDDAGSKTGAGADEAAKPALPEKQDTMAPPAAGSHGDDDADPTTGAQASADDAEATANSVLQKQDGMAPPVARSYHGGDAGSKTDARGAGEPNTNLALQKQDSGKRKPDVDDDEFSFYPEPAAPIASVQKDTSVASPAASNANQGNYGDAESKNGVRGGVNVDDPVNSALQKQDQDTLAPPAAGSQNDDAKSKYGERPGADGDPAHSALQKQGTLAAPVASTSQNQGNDGAKSKDAVRSSADDDPATANFSALQKRDTLPSAPPAASHPGDDDAQERPSNGARAGTDDEPIRSNSALQKDTLAPPQAAGSGNGGDGANSGAGGARTTQPVAPSSKNFDRDNDQCCGYKNGGSEESARPADRRQGAGPGGGGGRGPPATPVAHSAPIVEESASGPGANAGGGGGRAGGGAATRPPQEVAGGGGGGGGLPADPATLRPSGRINVDGGGQGGGGGGDGDGGGSHGLTPARADRVGDDPFLFPAAGDEVPPEEPQASKVPTFQEQKTASKLPSGLAAASPSAPAGPSTSVPGGEGGGGSPPASPAGGGDGADVGGGGDGSAAAAASSPGAEAAVESASLSRPQGQEQPKIYIMGTGDYTESEEPTFMERRYAAWSSGYERPFRPAKDAPLSPFGKQQAKAAGERFAAHVQSKRKEHHESSQVVVDSGTVFICSPMLRSLQTLDFFLQGAEPGLLFPEKRPRAEEKKKKIPRIFFAPELRPIGHDTYPVNNKGTPFGDWYNLYASPFHNIRFLAGWRQGKYPYAEFYGPLETNPWTAHAAGRIGEDAGVFFQFLRDLVAVPATTDAKAIDERAARLSGLHTILIVTDPVFLDAKGGTWKDGSMGFDNLNGVELKDFDGTPFSRKEINLLDVSEVFEITNQAGLTREKPTCQALWPLMPKRILLIGTGEFERNSVNAVPDPPLTTENSKTCPAGAGAGARDEKPRRTPEVMTGCMGEAMTRKAGKNFVTEYVQKTLHEDPETFFKDVIFFVSPMLRAMQTLDSFLLGADVPDFTSENRKKQKGGALPKNKIRLISELRPMTSRHGKVEPHAPPVIENIGTDWSEWKNHEKFKSVRLIQDFDFNPNPDDQTLGGEFAQFYDVSDKKSWRDGYEWAGVPMMNDGSFVESEANGSFDFFYGFTDRILQDETLYGRTVIIVAESTFLDGSYYFKDGCDPAPREEDPRRIHLMEPNGVTPLLRIDPPAPVCHLNDFAETMVLEVMNLGTVFVEGLLDEHDTLQLSCRALWLAPVKVQDEHAAARSFLALPLPVSPAATGPASASTTAEHPH
ncbi:unnamed protein product [Amoebophrya sp. A120]|nr:unnamed protein product [Amoebophrya sp. A120]|eukprot:GSA120T00007274001.1